MIIACHKPLRAKLARELATLRYYERVVARDVSRESGHHVIALDGRCVLVMCDPYVGALGVRLPGSFWREFIATTEYTHRSSFKDIFAHGCFHEMPRDWSSYLAPQPTAVRYGCAHDLRGSRQITDPHPPIVTCELRGVSHVLRAHTEARGAPPDPCWPLTRVVQRRF